MKVLPDIEYRRRLMRIMRGELKSRGVIWWTWRPKDLDKWHPHVAANQLRKLQEQGLVDSGSSRLSGWGTIWQLTDKGQTIPFEEIV